MTAIWSNHMTKAASVKGRWRIVEMQLWDKDFLDMMEPAYIVFDGKSGGEFVPTGDFCGHETDAAGVMRDTCSERCCTMAHLRIGYM